MTQQPGFPAAGPGSSTIETWTKAITQPSVTTFEQISAETPPNSNSRAYGWIFVSSLVAFLITWVANMIFASVVRSPAGEGLQQSSSVINVICVPVEAAIAVLFFALGVAITQFIARALGGTGTYKQLLYTSAAFSAPLTIISAI